jgi:alpha-beta hydrolase superfamily lysophospholipase
VTAGAVHPFLEAAGHGELGAYVAADGRTLRYRVVRASAERRALLYLHGIESHGAWFLAAAEELARRGCTTYLLDRRGSGLNGLVEPGDAASAAQLLDDVHRLRVHAGLDHVVLVGLSWGGKLALASALDRPEGVRALVLVTPGLVARVDLPWMEKLRLVFCLLFAPRARFDVPIDPEMFTRTPPILESIRNDPLRLERATARFFLASRSLGRAIRKRIDDLRVPVQLFLAGHDRIVDNQRTRALLERLPAGLLRARLYPHSTHSIQFDDTEELVEDMSAFLEEVA